MDLQTKSNEALHRETILLVKNERLNATKIIHYLRENQRRKLFSDFNLDSLWTYCTDELGYTKEEAHLRIRTSKLIVEIPEIEEKIEDESLTMSNLSLAYTLFSNEEIKDTERKKEILYAIENKTKAEAKETLLSFETEKTKDKVKDKQKKYDKTRTQHSFVIPDEVQAKLDLIKDYLGKNLPMAELISMMADLMITSLEKKKFKTLNKPEKDESLVPERVEKRFPSASLRRKVFLRDKCCVKCKSKRNLHVDHIIPWALGGETKLENLRLLCANCNQRARINAGLPGPESSPHRQSSRDHPSS